MTGLQLLTTHQDISLTELTGQIQKDLILSGIDPDYFNGIDSGETLLKRLEHFIQDILTYHPADFDRFMYRVDVAEKDFSGLTTTDLTLLVERIVFMILKRELQKIIFRKQFGQ